MCRVPQRGSHHWRGRYESLAFVDGCWERCLSTLAHVSCFGDLQLCGLSVSGVCLSQKEVKTGLITSKESSYCSRTDPQCASCSLPLNVSSICIGHEGCVCLSACEGPSWRELATEQLLRSASFQLTDHEACLLPESGVNVSLPEQSDDSCAWDPSQSHPRSCYDCLNSPLASGQVRGGLSVWRALAFYELTRCLSGDFIIELQHHALRALRLVQGSVQYIHGSPSQCHQCVLRIDQRQLLRGGRHRLHALPASSERVIPTLLCGPERLHLHSAMRVAALDTAGSLDQRLDHAHFHGLSDVGGYEPARSAAEEVHHLPRGPLPHGRGRALGLELAHG